MKAASDLGPRAEAAAERYLRSIGYTILERGFRQRFGELDLICRDGETVVFVEVKARTSGGYGGPEGAVNRAKRLKLARTAAAWLKARRPAFGGCRFDVVALRPEGLQHMKDAFESPLRFTL